MKITAIEIAQLINGEIIGDGDAIITHPGKIENASEGAITFLANPKYKKYIYSSDASAILVPCTLSLNKPVKSTLIKVENVYLALGKLLNLLNIRPEFPDGIDSSSGIAENATLSKSAKVGKYAVIEKGARIDDNSIIMPQAYIGKNVRIGKNCIIHPGVRIYHDCEIGDNCVIHSNTVIGADGFGYAHDGVGKYHKIPQIGNVVLENDVEIGANVVIDRATMGRTLIKEGVKLDNLIQIAHNVTIGKNTVIAAQAGIAGSAHLGENVIIGGQAGIAGHISIADKTMIQAQSGIASDIEKKGSKKYGSPALEYRDYLRSYVVFKHLPELSKEIHNLKEELKQLKEK